MNDTSFVTILKNNIILSTENVNEYNLYNPTMKMIKDFEIEKQDPIHNHFNLPTKIIPLEEYTLYFNNKSTIIEFGTKRSKTQIKTSHESLFSNYESYLKTDFEDGEDVDIICDIHDCSNLGYNKYDGILCMSVFEHIKRPWIAANELYKISKVNGYVFISTHQTFPLHGYPNDYFRFSTDALTLLMEDAGYKTLSCYYSEPCSIIPQNISTIYPNWNYLAESYMYVNYVGQKLN